MHKGINEVVTRNTLLFALADVVDENLLGLTRIAGLSGFVMRQEVKRDYNKVVAAIRQLRLRVDSCSERTIDNFGDDSDILNAIILMVIDRWGEDDRIAKQIYEHIKAMPSQGMLTGIDYLDRAFNHVTDNEEGGEA
jgi:hypothetical protein